MKRDLSSYEGIRLFIDVVFRVSNIETQAEGFDVAGDAFEEIGEPEAAHALHSWAQICRGSAVAHGGENPRAVPEGASLAIVCDAVPTSGDTKGGG